MGTAVLTPAFLSDFGHQGLSSRKISKIEVWLHLEVRGRGQKGWRAGMGERRVADWSAK